MIGDAAAKRLRRLDPAVGQKLRQQRAVMDDLIAPAEGRIFVLQAMQHMGIGGHDAREAVFRQGGDVAFGKILKGCFIAQPPREIAAIEFLCAQHGKIDSALAQQSHQRAQGALVAQIEGAVAQPEQHIGARHLREDRKIEIARPIEAGRQIAPAGIVGGLEFAQSRGRLACRGAILQRLVAAQIDDRIHMLDHHRAFAHAGAAGGAGPDRVAMHAAATAFAQADDRPATLRLRGGWGEPL